jgi:hypothetical protein
LFADGGVAAMKFHLLPDRVTTVAMSNCGIGFVLFTCDRERLIRYGGMLSLSSKIDCGE